MGELRQVTAAVMVVLPEEPFVLLLEVIRWVVELLVTAAVVFVLPEEPVVLLGCYSCCGRNFSVCAVAFALSNLVALFWNLYV